MANELFDFGGIALPEANPVEVKKKKAKPIADDLPEKLGKAWTDCKVPDFNDPNRPKTCLEVDFPIAQINELAQLEGNAGKPIYQMSKWWARRRSSVFRSMLLAAATEAPEDPSEAAKIIWDHYYCNHQKAGAYKNLKVLEPFMGGGTTLVEGARLGMQMTGIDLNPVAWFVCKNELAGSDPEQVAALFADIETQVKPQIQPFYTTTCPRGHKGHWIDIRTNLEANVNPLTLAPEDRVHYRWKGPEIIYTFWAKHGPCDGLSCHHRTPLFKSLIMAQKTMTANYIEQVCPHCGHKFQAELGESRMAHGAELVKLDDDADNITTLSQPFANLLNDYDKGSADDTLERLRSLIAATPTESGLVCPHCHQQAGRDLQRVLDTQASAHRVSERKKKAFGIQKKKVQLWLMVSPEWAKGAPDKDDNGNEYGGYAGAPAEATARWNAKRLEKLSLIEIRSQKEPETFFFHGQQISTNGTVPRQAHFTCQHCGKENNTLESVKPTHHTPPVAVYAFQCHCPQCEAEGYNYNGRYFKAADIEDIRRLDAAESEWERRSQADLNDLWPKQECWDAYMMRANGGVNDGWGYTHWWKMFNSRQLLVHTQLLKAIMDAHDEMRYPYDICEQALGAFQQYLRNENMFCFWDMGYDKLVPALSNANFHPKNSVVENCIFNDLGRGNVSSIQSTVFDGLQWCQNPWEAYATGAKSLHLDLKDAVQSGTSIYCGSSADLSMLDSSDYDLVITDPPFGNNLFYADLADFFYVWLRIPLRKWYEGLPEEAYWSPERTPHSAEAIDNEVEHPDTREEWEKDIYVTKRNLAAIRQQTGDNSIEINDLNPLYLPVPSSEFYSQTLAACWAEAGRHLKDGGLMAFTFHHNDDNAWIDVLKALFEAGYYLVATYPIRSDETKGDTAAFGSKKIEYDIIHVCRKRLAEPELVSYAKMRRFVKEETGRLKSLLEAVHGKALPEADLRVILRGKSLEFYSQHYGQVQTGTGEMLNVRDALLGINQMLDDLLEDASATGGVRPPEAAEPVSRLYLRIFRNLKSTTRDALHKTLQGSGVSQNDLEARGWIQVTGRDVKVVSIPDRYAALTRRGLTRKHIKSDLDQCFFLLGLVMAGRNLMNELANGTLKLKKSVPEILSWYEQTSDDAIIRGNAQKVISLLKQFEQQQKGEDKQQLLFDFMEGDNA